MLNNLNSERIMKIPSLKEIEEYAMLYAENKPRPTAIVDGFTECYNKFIKPMQQANGDEQSSSNCNIPLVSESASDAFDRGFTAGYNAGVKMGLHSR